MRAALSSMTRRDGAAVLPAVVVAGFGLYEIWVQALLEPGFPGSPVLHTLAVLVYSSALARRRATPVAALGAAVAAFVLEWQLFRGTGQLSAGAFVTAILLFYAVGSHARRRRGITAALAAAGVLLALDLADVAAGYEDTGEFVGLYLILAGSWAAGYALRRQRHEQTVRAAAEERARIARELHDVIAHSVTLMVIQMGAARQVLHADPGEAERQLLAGEGAGRDAVAELRRMLGLLKGSGDEPERSPQPSGRDLDRLLDENRAAGLPVELRVEGEADRLPSGIELAAYRIVQEALTNVRKHAAAGAADVTLRYGERELEIEVRDDGRGPAAEGASGHGHGVIGMRERAALYGGDLRIESAPGGGCRLRARLPLNGRA